jgi:hypothetical protein
MVETNKLIALFMGFEDESRILGGGQRMRKKTEWKYGCQQYEQYNYDQLKYHLEWNWLMPVVEKIETLSVLLPEIYKLGFLKNATYSNIDIRAEFDPREEFIGWYSSVSFELSHPFIFDSLNEEPRRYKTKIEALYIAVVKFIEWHNENKSK